ncbi:MAG: hypothetical protein CMN78_00405 [Spirochaetales bacterium]|nr:hypothetical protein [Spirochaetales bacterium]
MKCVLFILSLFTAFLAFAQNGTESSSSEIEKSIVCILDLSHSMAIVDADEEEPRYKRGIAAINHLLEETSGGGDEWALVIFDDRDALEIRQGFTRDRSAISARMTNLSTWGVTPLRRVFDFASEYLNTEGSGEKKYLILISDCINTDGNLYSLPPLDEVSERGIVPIVLGFRHPDYPDLWKSMDNWARDAGGAFLFISQFDQARRLIENGNVARAAPVHPESGGTMPIVLSAEPQETTREVQMPIWWIFLLPLLGNTGFLVLTGRRWFAKRRSILSIPHTSTPQIELTVIAKGLATATSTFTSFPVTVSGAGSADLVLPKAKIQRGARTFSLVLHEGVLFLRSRALMVINGVGHKIKELKIGDRITFGRFRVVYQGITYVEKEPVPVPSPKFLLLAPMLAVWLACSWLTRNPITIMIPGRSPEQPTIASIQNNLPAHELSENGSRVRGFQTDGRETETNEEETNADVAFPTVMWEPETPPDYFKVDALFIHAHPDDETLDFGVLISRFARADKRVAVVLLTDGDSGLDQYPQRIVNDKYPPYDLKGDILAGVRAGEARNALSVLGAQHYVRLGLKNHPYGGSLDVISADGVLREWGGEDALVERLSEIIIGYSPDVVVSPEGPALAFEHFEHEATGLIVERALQKLEKSKAFAPMGRLVSIDPLQKQLYESPVGIAAVEIGSENGLNYRAIQSSALKRHITQRDASVIGVENLPNFSHEFYRILRWDIELSLEEYLKTGYGSVTRLE